MGLFDFLKTDKNDSNSAKESEIEDFFKIDIHGLSKYAPFHTHTETSVTGNRVDYYTIVLDEPELGMFSSIEIIDVEKNKPNIVFHSYECGTGITKEFRDFVRSCSDKFGEDRQGQGEITTIDLRHIEHNIFSRMWDKVWINNSSDGMELTLFVISQKNES